MTDGLRKRIGTLLAESGTIATIATLDESGAPQCVPTPFLKQDETGRLLHLELLETSSTHRNLLGSIWFERPGESSPVQF
ncbi:MAG: pyridoxamine 5'-phosphate oxidase family protein [Desulfobulbaceae bacterium]|nr:pyridoxamine 5'-phosphate oxidase family protein [Desulfobulbaceae bacterium]